jgi:hypothetical protein
LRQPPAIRGRATTSPDATLRRAKNADDRGLDTSSNARRPTEIDLRLATVCSNRFVELPAVPNVGFRAAHRAIAGVLGGIGFTMSSFIANLAFAANAPLVNASKMAILLASLTSGIAGYLWLSWQAPSARTPS